MTALLEKAFVKTSNLPKAAQQQLAKQMLEDIEGELKWDRTLAESQPLLEKMADKARIAKQRSKNCSQGI